MSQPQSYIGVEPRTIQAAGTALVRGVRVAKDANGVCAIAGATVRGDFATLGAIAANAFGAGVSMSESTAIPLVSLTTATAGDAAYAAADGKVSTTSTNAAVVGRYRTTVAAANTFGEIELFSVA